jgi:carbon storage regulator
MSMLVLSRSRGQRIHVGGNVVVTVLSLRGNLVRLGIETPAEIGIARYETQAVRQTDARLSEDPT